MNTDSHTRALQHLIVQGFTLYTAAAAVCTRLVDRALLDEPRHVWAVYFGSNSLDWTARLANDDPLQEAFGAAAVRSARGAPHVVCHTLGGVLVVPLDVTACRDARMRIEGAIAQGKAPPPERLEAFSDDMIEREAQRRAFKASKAKDG
jgi:hypothetical protein